MTPQLKVQVQDSTLSQECIPELQPVLGDAGSSPLASDPPRASQCVHDCLVVPWPWDKRALSAQSDEALRNASTSCPQYIP